MSTLINQRESRVLFHEKFDGNGFTNNESLAKMRLTKADTLNPTITHLMGRESDKYPMTFLTEGQKGGFRRIDIENIEYDWPAMGKLKKSDAVVSHEYADTDNIGRAGAPVYVVFKSNWLKQQHMIMSPSGTIARLASGKPQKVSNGYRYTLQLVYRDADDTIPFEDLATNTRWTMTGGAPVSESYSSGNESNKQAPGKLKGQISILRKSYEFGGNISNRTVEFQFNIKGNKTRYWMPWEEYQHEQEFKEACEEHIWWATYNRDKFGNITTIDEETGFPIPIGAGIADQIPNINSYGFLTTRKLTNTIGDLLYGATDTEKMDVVLFTGKGGMREFSEALMRDANGNGSGWVLQGAAADKFVTGAAGSNKLSYGAYFNQFKHIDGHTITVKHLPLLDNGSRAENSPPHPVTGWPLCSYEMYFIDMSSYDGIRNVQMISQKGRSLVRGIEQGMTLIKGSSYGDYNGNALQLATDQDKTAVHFLKTLGINIRRNTHCLKMFCDLS